MLPMPGVYTVSPFLANKHFLYTQECILPGIFPARASWSQELTGRASLHSPDRAGREGGREQGLCKLQGSV